VPPSFETQVPFADELVAQPGYGYHPTFEGVFWGLAITKDSTRPEGKEKWRWWFTAKTVPGISWPMKKEEDSSLFLRTSHRSIEVSKFHDSPFLFLFRFSYEVSVFTIIHPRSLQCIVGWTTFQRKAISIWWVYDVEWFDHLFVHRVGTTIEAKFIQWQHGHELGQPRFPRDLSTV
jgi:hypothetical protein